MQQRNNATMQQRNKTEFRPGDHAQEERNGVALHREQLLVLALPGLRVVEERRVVSLRARGQQIAVRLGDPEVDGHMDESWRDPPKLEA